MLSDYVYIIKGGWIPAPFTLNYIPDVRDDLIEYRYEQRGDTYLLRSWHHGTERTTRGLNKDKPEWLTDIITTAQVGGHIRHITEPPPEIILWFRTDEQHNLDSFIELT
jgi:hypothetical protein